MTRPEYQTLQLTQFVFQTQYSSNYNVAFASYILVLLPVLIAYTIFQKKIIAGAVTGAVKE